MIKVYGKVFSLCLQSAQQFLIPLSTEKRFIKANLENYIGKVLFFITSFQKILSRGKNLTKNIPVSLFNLISIPGFLPCQKGADITQDLKAKKKQKLG